MGKGKSSRRTKEPRFQELVSVADINSGYAPTESFGLYSEAYAVHVWVYACVRAIASNLAGIEILPYIEKSDGSWVVNERHEFFPVLKRPNPHMSTYNLREYTAAAMKLNGNAYWYLERFGGTKVKEIWPLLPDDVKPYPSSKKLVDHYGLSVNGKEIPLAFDEVIHFKSFSPNSFIFGQGALTAARNTIATDIYAQIWNKAFFGNAARPDGVLQSDRELSDDTRKRVIESWKQMHQGVSKQGRTAILEDGLKYSQISASTKDMDFVNLRKDLRTEVLAAFGVPPSVVGLLEYANYSNMEQQVKTFWGQTLLPELRNLEETLNLRIPQLTMDYKTIFQAKTEDVDALQESLSTKAVTAKTFIDAGYPPNQVTDALDLPFEHFEGGDVPRVPQAAPLANPAAPDDMPTEDMPPAKGKAYQDNIDPEIGRAETWKKFDRLSREKENRFIVAMRGFFRGQKKRVLYAIEKNRVALLNSKGKKSVDDVLNMAFDIKKENAYMGSSAGKLIKGTYFDFLIKTGQSIKPDFDFKLDDPIANAWIKAKELKLVQEANDYTLESISDSVKEAIQEAVASGFSDDDTIKEIIDRIKDVYDFAVEGRAERIARTETISAANAGNLEAMKRTGVEKKEWLSSRDERVRETHQAMDGQTVGVADSFLSPSGATLQFPGDPNAPADEIINCRCVPLPITKKSED